MIVALPRSSKRIKLDFIFSVGEITLVALAKSAENSRNFPDHIAQSQNATPALRQANWPKTAGEANWNQNEQVLIPPTALEETNHRLH